MNATENQKHNAPVYGLGKTQPGNNVALTTPATQPPAEKAGKKGEKRAQPAIHPAGHFKGYTLEEMRMRKVVNELKIDITKEKLRSMVSPKAREESNAIKSYVRGFDSAMKYFDIAMLAFGVGKRVFSLFRRIGGKRRTR